MQMFGYDFIRSLFLGCLVVTNNDDYVGTAQIPFTSNTTLYVTPEPVNDSGKSPGAMRAGRQFNPHPGPLPEGEGENRRWGTLFIPSPFQGEG